MFDQCALYLPCLAQAGDHHLGLLRVQCATAIQVEATEDIVDLLRRDLAAGRATAGKAAAGRAAVGAFAASTGGSTLGSLPSLGDLRPLAAGRRRPLGVRRRVLPPFDPVPTSQDARRRSLGARRGVSPSEEVEYGAAEVRL